MGLEDLFECEGCRTESGDCPLFVCYDDGFYLVCCLVYAIKRNLVLIKKMGEKDEEDEV